MPAFSREPFSPEFGLALWNESIVRRAAAALNGGAARKAPPLRLYRCAPARGLSSQAGPPLQKSEGRSAARRTDRPRLARRGRVLRQRARLAALHVRLSASLSAFASASGPRLRVPDVSPGRQRAPRTGAVVPPGRVPKPPGCRGDEPRRAGAAQVHGDRLRDPYALREPLACSPAAHPACSIKPASPVDAPRRTRLSVYNPIMGLCKAEKNIDG